MSDKPIPAKILLPLIDADASGEAFIGLSTSLYHQNLIFDEPRELRKRNGKLELTVIFRDINSFKKWKNNEAIRQFWMPKFEKLLSSVPKTKEETDVLIEIDHIENCTCTTSEFLILQGRAFRFTDELTCGTCLKQISYTTIPLNIKIEDWQIKYQRIYLNWLESGLFEKEALKELKNYKNGKLNKAGALIRKELETYFKIPVYITYFTEEPDNNHTCIVCKDKGQASGLERPARICKECHTIFSY